MTCRQANCIPFVTKIHQDRPRGMSVVLAILSVGSLDPSLSCSSVLVLPCGKTALPVFRPREAVRYE